MGPTPVGSAMLVLTPEAAAEVAASAGAPSFVSAEMAEWLLVHQLADLGGTSSVVVGDGELVTPLAVFSRWLPVELPDGAAALVVASPAKRSTLAWAPEDGEQTPSPEAVEDLRAVMEKIHPRLGDAGLVVV